jgi:histidinol dehydrogenase
MLRIAHESSAEFETLLASLADRGETDLERVEPAVREIIAAVRARGDSAVLELTEKFDRRRPSKVALTPPEWHAIAARAPRELRARLEEAGGRIRRYHEHQRDAGFAYREDGIELGQRVLPVGAAGVYAPGGKARYPSTVLMSAIPASVAGVERIVLATPDPTPEVCAAAEVAGVTEVIDAGGAQAIAALAYGTESVAAVGVVVGPGNIYVACAKRLVFGKVAIDQIAGPSEILVVADGTADARLVAADLLSQAEHDEDAYALLVTTDSTLAERTRDEVAEQLADLPRRAIAERSIDEKGCAFVVGDLDRAAAVADRIAPEHLALHVADPAALAARVRAAGAIFLGAYTPEAAGDYAAGPSHVLPTGGATRFGSPLGVYDFVVRTSMVRYDRDALRRQSGLLTDLARMEGLEAHARAVELRK